MNRPRWSSLDEDERAPTEADGPPESPPRTVAAAPEHRPARDDEASDSELLAARWRRWYVERTRAMERAAREASERP